MKNITAPIRHRLLALAAAVLLALAPGRAAAQILYVANGNGLGVRLGVGLQHVTKLAEFSKAL